MNRSGNRAVQAGFITSALYPRPPMNAIRPQAQVYPGFLSHTEEGTKSAQPLERRQSCFTELSGEKGLADYSRVSSLEKRLQKPSFKKSGLMIPKSGISPIPQAYPGCARTGGRQTAACDAGGVNRPQRSQRRGASAAKPAPRPSRGIESCRKGTPAPFGCRRDGTRRFEAGPSCGKKRPPESQAVYRRFRRALVVSK